MKTLIALTAILLSLSNMAAQYKCSMKDAESKNDYMIVDLNSAEVQEYTEGQLSETYQAEKVDEMAVQFDMSTPNGFDFETTIDIAKNTITFEMAPYPANTLKIECEEVE